MGTSALGPLWFLGDFSAAGKQHAGLRFPLRLLRLKRLLHRVLEVLERFRPFDHFSPSFHIRLGYGTCYHSGMAQHYGVMCGNPAAQEEHLAFRGEREFPQDSRVSLGPIVCLECGWVQTYRRDQYFEIDPEQQDAKP